MLAADGIDRASGWALDPMRTIGENKRALALAAGLGLAAALVASFLTGPRYSSSASLLPQTRRASTNLPAMAAQLGLSLGGEPNQSPQFYVDLLKSREILRPAVTSTFNYIDDGKQRSGTLAEIYGVDNPRTERGIRDAMDILERNVDAGSSAKTGVVKVRVRTKSAGLSALVLQRILEQLNTFNLETRQSQASAERRFTEERLSTARAELRAAEERLQSFMQDNREWRSSPKLTFDHDRLAREIGTRQQVYTTLMQMYEQARMDEVRNTPLIGIVERPDVPLKPDSRHLIRNAVLGMALALLAALVTVFALERFGRRRVTSARQG